MSSTHRPGDGSGYYPSGDVLARQQQQQQGEPAAGWGSGYYPQETARNWAGGGEMGGAAGAQNSPYPGYDPSGWNCAGQPRPPYPPTYTVGSQGMEHYTNGSYGPAPYNQSTMNPPYPGLHPANPYYPSPSQPHYPVDPYKSAMQQGAPQAPSHWGYPQQGHNIPQQRPPFPQYPPPQGPRDESWNVYGAPNHYQWPSAPTHNPNGPHYMTGARPPWQGGDVQSPVYDVKDSPQNLGYNQRPFPGYPSDIPPPCPPSEAKPNLPPPNPHYSASPQMYNRKEPSNPESVPRSKEANNLPSDPSSISHPGLLKINQVLERVVDLEREVDEFVGKKTEMSYRCLEEMLTKELLELDSVETGGQDSIRQARKEAVRRLQSILERLEKKGL